MIVLATPHEQFAIIQFSAIQALGGCTRAEILTFNALALHADPSGHCWPGRERLSAITQLTESRISKATSGLERKGLIRKEVIAGIRVDYYLLPQASQPLSARPPEPLPVSMPTPARNGTPPLPETAPRTDQRTDQKTERAEAEPAAPEPTPVTPLSPVVLRTCKTPAPDCIPEAWIPIAVDLRPDLPIEAIEKSAARFLDDRRSKGIELVDWLPSWRNWIRNERGPKPVKAPNSAHNTPWAMVQPNPYAGWEPGKKAPIGAAVTPEQTIAAFERDMERVGATKDADGVWQRPLTNEVAPAPVTEAVEIDLAPDPDPDLAPITEKPRHSPLHGLLGGLRNLAPAVKPASVPWQRPAAPIIDPVELAKAEALLAEEVARKKETRYQFHTDSS